MQREGNLYTFLFAFGICVICSLGLALAYSNLRPRQLANIKLDKQKNIMVASGILSKEVIGSKSREALSQLFADNFESQVLDLKGNITDKTVDMVPPKSKTDLILYKRKAVDGSRPIYVFPIAGKGLWSTMYGYFALEDDLNTVKGITFYQHGETPGLGAEVDQAWFTANYVGKRILNKNGNLVSVSIVKGKVKDIPEGLKPHSVDGISGATLTCNGVNAFLIRTLALYEAYFSKIRVN